MTNKKQKPEADNPRRTIVVGSGDLLGVVHSSAKCDKLWG
jgi:hypothetical protein